MSFQVPELPDWFRSAVILDPVDIWGNAVIIGLRELAIRLGYPGGYDDRGQALLVDDFQSGLRKGETLISGTGAKVELSSTNSRFGGLSLKLTAGSDSSRYAGYSYYLPYHAQTNIGLQLAFVVEANTEYVELDLTLYDGAKDHLARVRYDHVNSKVQYYDSAAAWQDLITGVELKALDEYFHFMKVVVDLENDKYLRVLVDSWSWTTGDLDIYTGTIITTKLLSWEIYHVGKAATNAVSYIDGVITTWNEPA